jgi:hypothetical protein
MRRREVNLFRATLAVALLILGQSCATKGTITAEPKSEILLLNGSYGVVEKLGETPVPLTSEANVARFLLNRKNQFPEYLIVMYPKQVDGQLILKTSTSEARSNIISAYRIYLELLLRGHRHLMRGEISQAKEVLAVVNSQFDATFGGLYLTGVIALLEGNVQDARRQIQLAKSLFPDATELQEIVP